MAEYSDDAILQAAATLAGAEMQARAIAQGGKPSPMGIGDPALTLESVLRRMASIGIGTSKP